MAIFINYRREDSSAIAGRIDDHLRAAFGPGEVYRDIDNIPLGVDFVVHLNEALAKCDFLIAIIGPGWLTNRLHDEHDFVRLELEAAPRRQIPTVPLLVDGAQMPTNEQVPVSLQPLVRRQAARIDSGSDFRAHIQRVVEAVKAQRASMQARALTPALPQVRRKGSLGLLLWFVVGAVSLGTAVLVKQSCGSNDVAPAAVTPDPIPTPGKGHTQISSTSKAAVDLGPKLEKANLP